MKRTVILLLEELERQNQIKERHERLLRKYPTNIHRSEIEKIICEAGNYIVELGESIKILEK